MIPVLKDMSHLFAASAALQNGDIVSMPCDRHHGSTKSLECNFFNGKADFPIGAFTFAASFDVEVISIFVIKKSVKEYMVYVKPVAVERNDLSKNEKVKQLTKSYVNELESIANEYPEQWFNYYEFWKKETQS